MATQKPTKPLPSKERGLPSRIDDRDHEAVLIVAAGALAGEFRLAFQSVDGLNGINPLISGCESDWRKRIDALVRIKNLPPEQQAIWEQAPSVRFSDRNDLPLPNVRLGANLFSHLDGRGNNRGVPLKIFTADVCVEFTALEVGVDLRDKGYSFPEGPILKPENGISTTQHSQAVSMHGLVFSSGTTLGRAAAELADLSESIEINSINYRHQQMCAVGSQYVFFVTNNASIWDGLINQYPGFWVANGEIEDHTLDDIADRFHRNDSNRRFLKW